MYASNPVRWGKAGAGVLILARDTGRILLTLRSGAVMEPHTWGVPGGKLDEGETALQAAEREMDEELGIVPEPGSRLTLLYTFKETGFRYDTFIGIVARESAVRPRLNWESDDAQWFDLDELPSPLHPGVRGMMRAKGVKATLREAVR